MGYLRHVVAWSYVLEFKGFNYIRAPGVSSPAPYAGVLIVRCAIGAKPRGQCTESGSHGDRRTPPEALSG